MQLVVAKSFNTASRRFAAGRPVTEADIDGPVPFDTWKDRGFIAVAPEAAPAKKAKAEPAAG